MLIAAITNSNKYRVFFIEGDTECGCKIDKILLFNGGFGLKIMVTTVQLISDQFKTYV